MTTYSIQAPDGKTYTIDGPAGASDDQVRAEVLRQNPSAGTSRKDAESATLNAMPGIDKFAVGLARPIIRTTLGLKQLSGSPVNLDVDDQGGLIGTDSGEKTLSANDKAVLQHLSEVKGGAATAGDVLGNVAMLAAPGGITSALPMATRAAADVAANAGMSALAVPEDGKTRTQNAITGAEGAIGGQLVGKALKYGINGVGAIGDTAKQFLADNIPLTLGQRLGPIGQSAEQVLAKVPVLGSMIKARQNEALSAWNLKILGDTANSVDTGGTGDIIDAVGPKGFQQATKIFNDAYDFHWDRPIPLDAKALGNSWESIAQTAQNNLSPEAGSVVQRKLANTLNDIGSIANPKTGVVNGSQLQDIDKGLGDAARDAARSGQGDVASLLGQAKSSLRDTYPDSFRDSLDALDSKYADFVRLRRAGSYSGANAGQPFTPAQLLQASTALDRSAGKGATARGTAVMQQPAVDALSVFPKGTGASPSGFDNALGLTSLVGSHFVPHSAPALAALGSLYLKQGTKALAGSTAPQKLAQALDQSALSQSVQEYMRQLNVGPAQIGSAVADAESN